MKTAAILVLGLLAGGVLIALAPSTARAQSAQAPKPGLCRVTFDSVGRVSKFVITQSSSSAAFDETIARFARASWRGQPNTSESVVIDSGLKLLKSPGEDVPKPPYPIQARIDHQMGSGMCLVTFDASGNVASEVMTKSIGWPLLDENTLLWAKHYWKGQPNATRVVPITYRLLLRSPTYDWVAHPASSG